MQSGLDRPGHPSVHWAPTDLKAFSDSYRCLARDPLGLSSLWLGEDDLVYVKGSGFLMPFTEEYKRFRLGEIQSFSVAKTSRTGLTLLYVFLLLFSAVIAGLIAGLSESYHLAKILTLSFFSAGALGALAMLVRHLILGPVCVCDIQTRLTKERLRPLRRYHFTLETVSRIDGLVREKQTDLPKPDGAEGEASAFRRVASKGPGDFYRVPKVVVPAFALFVVLGILGLLGLHLESLLVTGIVLVLLLVGSLLVTLSLVSVVRTPTPMSLRTALWVLMGFHFLVIGTGAVYFLVVAAGNPAYTVGLGGPLEAYTALPSEGGMALYGVFCAFFLGYLVCGGIGLGSARVWGKRQTLLAAVPDAEGGSAEGEAPE